MVKKNKEKPAEVFEGKLNKYGFIHIGKELLERTGLPKKIDVPLKLEYDAENNAIVCTIVGESTPYPIEEEKTAGFFKILLF